jgi:drug/metabolite transporter (DMT)-like permease
MVTTPMIVLILSAIFLKERLRLVRIIGILIGFTGTAGLIFLTSGKGADASNPLVGNFLIFINAVSYSFYIILASKLTQRYHVLTLMKWLYLFGILFITPVAFHELGEWNPLATDMDTLLYAGYVVLFATFGTYMLNIIAIKNLKPSVVAVFVYLQPLLATLIAVGLDKDTLTWTKAIAGVLIFTGVYLTTKKPTKRTTPA